jgi:aldose 1-epimerase
MLTLSGGDWQAEVLPEAGGLIASLTHKGVEVLRTLPAGSRNPLDAACFPLVPYANRIAHASFPMAGAHVQLPRNFPPETGNLHGIGWESAWEVTAQGTFKCALEHRHEGLGPAPWKDDITCWPWAYQADQRVMLGPKGCAISLTLTNRSNVPMPAGLGLHPYFRRRPETRVRFAAAGMLPVNHALIPTGEVAAPDLFADFARGSTLPADTIDHCFTAWDGMATISDDLGQITVMARGAPHLHLYAPADGSALCLEPVSHTPDALNQDPASMTLVPPGCSASLQMWITATAIGAGDQRPQWLCRGRPFCAVPRYLRANSITPPSPS